MEVSWWFWLLSLAALVGWIELLARILIRYLLPLFSAKSPFFRKIHLYITDNPDNLYYSRYVPHPFLQFTNPRTRLPGHPADALLGFKNIRLSQRKKPAGMIRVACMGGSTTEDGYPELLQQMLDRVSGPGRFQVFNFGMTWWSSIHSVVNFVLNVRDYAPDYLILHDNCNDHHYRGYPLMSGDGSHAYRVFLIPHGIDEAFYRFSIIYRVIKIICVWFMPDVFRPSLEIKDIGLLPEKKYEYNESEIWLFRRNIETICTLAKDDGIATILATMPMSKMMSFGAAHEKAYRPHIQDANRIITEVSLNRGVLIVDLASAMDGHEEYFKDPVHCTVAGNTKKAAMVAATILRAQGIAFPDEIHA